MSLVNICATGRPGRNKTIVTRCGKLIPMIKQDYSFNYYKSDKTKVTSAWLKVTCIECLEAVARKMSANLCEIDTRIVKIQKERNEKAKIQRP